MSYNANMLVNLQRVIALVILSIVAPLFGVISLIILVQSGWPVIYFQKRMGKGKKPFWIWKFRTMGQNASRRQHYYRSLNEADGPVFKIRNDPRFTKFGKWLSWSGLDELPQLINVIKGEMALVGPRPLPVAEAHSVPKKYSGRFNVLPGITSSWVVAGAHKLTYVEWMELDLNYIKNRSFYLDLTIILRTILLITKSSIQTKLVNWQSFLLGGVVAGGLLVRYVRIVTELVWNDETYYFTVAQSTSFLKLLVTSHWIVDHPPFYLIFIHFWSKISTGPFWIRSPNLIVYLLSSYFVFKIGSKLFKSYLTQLILIVIYSFFPYFVGLEWQAIPYTFAMSFFVISFYYFFILFEENSGRKSAIVCAIFLSLFFYTSFEAVYYIASLFIFSLILFASRSKEIRKRIVLLFSTSLLIALPEIIVLFYKLPFFAQANTHWEIWKWQGALMLKDVFGITIFPVILVLFGTIFCFSLWKMINDKSRHIAILLLICLIGGFFVSLSLVSHLFFYASHPKAYYYVIFLIWLLLLSIFDWGVDKYPKRFFLLMVIGVISSVFWFSPKERWSVADYLYISGLPSPFAVRDSLIELLNKDNRFTIVTDDELSGDRGEPDWIEAISLDRYYLACYDIYDSNDCQKLVMARKSFEQIMDKDNQLLVGIILKKESQQYFVKNICPSKEACLIWDFAKNRIIRVK